MTIQNTTIRKAGPSQGNGINASFPFTFKVFIAADILVTYLNSASAESILVLNSDYTVTLNTDQNTSPGGTVTMRWIPATGTSITLTSQVSNTQNLALTNAGGFYPATINDALDRVVIQVQQLAEQLNRTFKIPISSVLVAGTSVADYLATAASSAATAVAAQVAASNSATSAISYASSAASSAASATTSILAFSAPSALAIANYIDTYLPAPQITPFATLYLAGGWDMGSLTTPAFANETILRRASLATGSTTHDLGTVP